MKRETRHSMALVAFLAWVGLGAEGLSSSSYGPEKTFKALGAHAQLGLYMAIATAVTVFIIALAYNQVIELFPTGGRYRLSLAFTAAGIILLYLLWDARPTPGETLDASTFRIIIGSMGLGGPLLNQVLPVIVQAFEAALVG